MADNTISTLDYSEEINEFWLYTVLADLSIEAKASLERKISRRTKELQAENDLKRQQNAAFANDINQFEQQKQGILASIESGRSRYEALQVKYLLAKQERLDEIENKNANIKQREEQWLTITKRWETIPFIKEYLDKQEKLETVRANNNAKKLESEKLRSQIVLKKAELFEKDKKNIIKMADFMINKRPVLLKLINEKINEIKKFENEVKMTVLGINTAFATTSTLPMIEAKKMSTENSWDSSRHNCYDTVALPKLHLPDMDVGTISQVQNYNYNRATNKRPYEACVTVKLTKKAKDAEEIEKEDLSKYTYFISPRNIGGSDTKKYSDKKLINIVDDVMINMNDIYKIVPKLNVNELQDVNVIKARVSQDSKKNDPAQNMANQKITEVVEEVDSIKVSQDIILPPTPFMDLTQVNQKITEVVEEIDLTQKVSQHFILPPTPFLDLPQNSQEKRVTFNTVVRVEDIPNLETDGDDVIPQDDYNAVKYTPNDQLNASTASDDSYKKIKDFVFKKYNVNLSPEFTYTKNKIVPMVAEEKVVTSKFFDENQAGNVIDNSAKEKIETGNPEKEINEVPTETINQDNFTAENLLEGQGYKQQDDVPSCAPSFPYIQRMPDSPNVSTSTTGYEDTEFPQCIDSSFLLSPKAYDEKETRDDARNVTMLPQQIASIMSGIRKTPFSFFGESSSLNSPGADRQNDNNKFNNFTFGGTEKTKKGGFFSMFQ